MGKVQKVFKYFVTLVILVVIILMSNYWLKTTFNLFVEYNFSRFFTFVLQIDFFNFLNSLQLLDFFIYLNLFSSLGLFIALIIENYRRNINDIIPESRVIILEYVLLFFTLFLWPIGLYFTDRGIRKIYKASKKSNKPKMDGNRYIID